MHVHWMDEQMNMLPEDVMTQSGSTSPDSPEKENQQNVYI